MAKSALRFCLVDQLLSSICLHPINMLLLYHIGVLQWSMMANSGIIWMVWTFTPHLRASGNQCLHTTPVPQVIGPAAVLFLLAHQAVSSVGSEDGGEVWGAHPEPREVGIVGWNCQ